MIRGCSLVAEWLLPKQQVRVRFPVSAQKKTARIVLCYWAAPHPREKII